MDEIAQLKASIVLDKKELRDDIISGLTLAQNYADKEHVKIKLEGDATEINKLIERFQKQNPDVKIDLSFTNTDKQLKTIVDKSAKQGEKAGENFSKEFNQSFDNIDISTALKKINESIKSFSNEVKSSFKEIKDDIDNIGSDSKFEQKLDNISTKAKETAKEIENASNKIQQTTIPDVNLNKDTLSSKNTGVDSSENSSLTLINEKVKDITTAVEEKTNAFNNEKITVKSVAESEVSNLDKVLKKVNDIKHAAKDIPNIDTPIQDNNNNQPSPIVSPKFSQRKLNTSTAKLLAIDVGIERNLDDSIAGVELLKKRLAELKHESNSIGDAKGLENFRQSVLELDANYKKLIVDQAKLYKESKAQKVSHFDSKIADELQRHTKNTKAAKEYREELVRIREELNHKGLTDNEFNKLADDFNRAEAMLHDMGDTGLSFFDKWKNRVENMGLTLTTFTSFSNIADLAKETFHTIVDLDDQIVDINKTFQGTNKELSEMYYNSSSIAKELGVSTKAVLEQEAAWSRAGYSVKATAEEMAKVSSQFASISPGMDMETSQNGLVSIMKAFDIDTKDVEREVLDTINVVGNKFNTTNTDIVEGLQRSSAALSAGNNTLKESIALFTGGQEIVNNAEVMGQSLKTISLRIRGFDEETEELSDDLKNISGDIADLTKTADHSSGVSLFTDEAKQTYKSTFQILSDIYDIYYELTDKQQAELTQKLFGTTRANLCPYVQKCA